MERLQEQQRYMSDASPTVQGIAQLALATVDNTYSCSGDPRQDAAAELYLPYHNGLHTRNVCSDVRLLRDVVGLTPYEYSVALLAASSHDIFQELDAKNGTNETESSEWLVEKMAAWPNDFTKLQIEAGRLAVLGTRSTYFDYSLKQQATRQDYPTLRAELIAHTVASADLGRLYTVDGPYMSHKLHQEQTTGGSSLKPPIEGVTAFLEAQLWLFNGGYFYPNKDIERVLSVNKRRVQTYNEAILKDLRAGRIENWDQLIDKDKQFMLENK